jgi:hypothetical protein
VRLARSCGATHFEWSHLWIYWGVEHAMPVYTMEQGQAVPLVDMDGQLAFAAPRDGQQVVRLRYVTRPWLFGVAALAVLLGSVAVGRTRGGGAQRR